MMLNKTRLPLLPGNMDCDGCQTHIFQLDSVINILGFPLKDDSSGLHVH